MAEKPTYEELERRVRELEEKEAARKVVEQTLRNSEAKLLKSLKENYLFYSCNADRDLTHVSPNIKEMLGYSQEEFIRNFKNLLTDHPANKRCVESPGVPLYEQSAYEIEIFHADGSRRWLEVTEVPALNPAGKVFSVDAIVHDITRRKTAEIGREKLINELRNALAEIKTLRGIIPICSHCKQIRDDEGSWNQLEDYIHHHSEAEFSHGMCPDCFKKEMEKLDNED
jgi:PAS domain S-box-containing protein